VLRTTRLRQTPSDPETHLLCIVRGCRCPGSDTLPCELGAVTPASPSLSDGRKAAAAVGTRPRSIWSNDYREEFSGRCVASEKWTVPALRHRRYRCQLRARAATHSRSALYRHLFSLYSGLRTRLPATGATGLRLTCASHRQTASKTPLLALRGERTAAAAVGVMTGRCGAVSLPAPASPSTPPLGFSIAATAGAVRGPAPDLARCTGLPYPRVISVVVSSELK
jgi:hypothetical protein